MDAMQPRNASLSGFRSAEFQRAIGYLYVVESTQGGEGGDFTSGAWRIRPLNSVIINTIPDSDVSALPAITLPRGIYDIIARAPGYVVDTHATRLYDVTNAAEILPGSAATAPTGVQTDSWVMGRFYLSGDTQIRLEHQCQTTNAGDGMGHATSFAVSNEIYAEMSIWKVG